MQIRLLYKGTLRVLLVLLHDFPEFLCDHHFSFCDVIPTTCIQMRNLILSAFPRSMRLPDPFTPNLKVRVLSTLEGNEQGVAPGDTGWLLLSSAVRVVAVEQRKICCMQCAEALLS